MKLFCTFALAFTMLFAASADAQGPGTSTPTGVTIAPMMMADKTVRVGEPICYTLVARDDNGNIIRSWDQHGTPVTITLYNSTANTDSSTQSWSADPDDYSWARFYHDGVELTTLSPNEWTVPHTEFENGTIEVCLVHTKSDTGVYYEITPKFPPLNQVSETVTFTVGDVKNFLVEITSSVPGMNQVFLFRKYEVTVSPRDRYLNVSDEEVKAYFSARFPGEFVSAQPGFSDIFSGAVFIDGPTNYFLASTTARELPQALGQLQLIRADGADDPSIKGQTAQYEILHHAPTPFTLQTPEDHTTWILDGFSVQRQFTWERPSPPDPYTNILISNSTGEIGEDVVTYEWVCIDSTSLTRAQRIASNNSGSLPLIELTNYQLVGVGSAIAGAQAWKQQNIVWFVEATDGLYTTRSTPPSNDPQMRPGYHMTWLRVTGVEPLPQAPSGVALHQNFPNPFNPSTNIQFETAQAGHVSLKVYDIVGNEVATLVDEQLSPGVYNATFDATTQSTGVYMYQLKSNGKTFTKQMVLSK